MPRRILATAIQVSDCPIYKKGDKLLISLPEVVAEESDGICAIAVADLLPWTVKLTAGGGTPKDSLLCRGCRAGRAQASFRLEALEDKTAGPQTARRLISVKKIKLFAGLGERQLEKIVEFVHEIDFGPGEPIIVANEPGKALFIVTSGRVEVVKPAKDEEPEMILGVLEAGECVGEMSLLTGDPASATIRAREPVKALRISKDDFAVLLQKNPVINAYFSKLLALRLKQTNTAASKAFLEEIEKGVTGQLSMLAGAELVQAIGAMDRTGVLGVSANGRTLELYFVAGQVHFLKIDPRVEGPLEEIFYDFLGWRQGSFRFAPGERPDLVRNFFKDTTGLLLEGMRRLDEKAGIAAQAIGALEEPKKPEPKAEKTEPEKPQDDEDETTSFKIELPPEAKSEAASKPREDAPPEAAAPA